jgi:hypothetical protein
VLCCSIAPPSTPSEFSKLVDVRSNVPKEFTDGNSAVHGFVLPFPASKDGEVSNELKESLCIAFTLGATQLVIIITVMRSVDVSDKPSVFFSAVVPTDLYSGVKLYSPKIRK